MNLKNNKGYVGVDISIAVIILLILVPVIMGIVYNVNSSSHTTKVKSGATNIAVNTMEIAKGISLSKTDIEFRKAIFEEIKNIYNLTETITDETETIPIDLDNGSYVLKVEVTDYAESNENKVSNVVKTIKATVEYMVRGETQSIDLSTVVKID